MRRIFQIAILTALLAWSGSGLASESTNFRLQQDQVAAGVGSGASLSYINARAIVGQSGTGVLTSLNFTLNLGTQENVQPPGGAGRAIDVQGTIGDSTATVVVKALNTVTATVSAGLWAAKGVQLAEGPNTITITATDSGGSTTTKQIHVTVDTIPPPPPTLQSPITPTAAAPQSLSGTKVPDAGVWLNGAQIAPVDLANTWSYGLTLAQGANAIDLWAKDRAGNTSTHVAAQIIYDATPPATPIVTDDGRSTTSTHQLHARWSSQEDATEVVNYAYAIGTTAAGTDLVPFTSMGTQTEVTQTGLSLTEGTKYYFTVKATNAVGLVSSTGVSDGIRVNLYPPTITSASPADGGKFYPPATVVCSISASDPSGDLLQYRFLLNDQVVRDWSASNSFSLDTSVFSPGLKTLQMEVQDPFDGVAGRSVQLYFYRKPIKAKE